MQSQDKSYMQLLRDEDVFLSILENLNSGVALIDENGRFISYNKKFLNLFGLSEESTIKNVNDQNWAEWQVFGEDLKILNVDDHPVRKAAITGKSVRNQLAGVKLPGGSEIIWMLISAEPLFSEGKIIKTICTYLDVTEHKLADAALRRSEQALRDLNATKDKMFSIISHDLKSPFTSIIGFTELVLNKLNQNDIKTAIDYTMTVLDSAWQTMDLLTNLIDWSKMQSGKINFHPTSFDYPALIREVVSLFQATARHKSVIISVSTLNDFEIFADRSMMGSVLRNLLSNAIKFSNPGGVVEVIAIKEDDSIITSVCDSGTGMTQELVNRLTDGDYVSLPGTRNEGGSGLGLIIVKEFILRHRGEISILSHPGKGTKISFRIRNVNYQ